MKLNLYILCICVTLNLASAGSRILFVFPTPSKSQMVVGESVAKLLAENGHEVTVVSLFPLEKPVENYRDVKIEFEDELKGIFKKLMSKSSSKFNLELMNELFTIADKIGPVFMESPEMQNLMKEEKFDLLILGFVPLNTFMLGLADHFKCPAILLNTAEVHTSLMTLIGNPLGINSVPHFLISSSKMDSFMNRVKNFLISSFELVTGVYVNRLEEKKYEKYFPDNKYSIYDQAKQKVSLVLLNSHFSTTGPRPLLPNVIEIGGIQVKPKASKLSKELQSFLDLATDGAILISFGSNAKTSFFSDQTVKIFLKVFAKLKQRVVMKWETNELVGKPENVFIAKWLPQDDILAHPNIKLFISHCGLGSVTESKYHGVPVLGIPLLGDQPENADQIEKEGWATQINLSSLNENSFFIAINEMIHNKSYVEKVKKLSKIVRDRPMSSQETALFWIEYVLRHKSTSHLQYPAADLNVFQRNSLDVIAFILIVLSVVIELIWIGCKSLFSKKTTVITKRKKRN